MSERDLELVEIYRAKNLPEAHIIRLMMEQEGIDVSISNETLQGILGEIAMGWSTSPRVLVKQQDTEAARKVLLSHADHAIREEGPTDEDSLKCFACGNLMGDSSVCATCGWSYGDDQVAMPAATIDHSESTPLNSAVDQLPDEDNYQVDGGDGKTGTMSVLPTREVWLELSVVMSIGFVPNLINSLLSFQPSTDVNPYWVVAVQFMPYSIYSTLATLYIIRRSGEKWSEFGFGRLWFTDFVLGFVLMTIVLYFGGILQAAIADGKTSAESVIQSPHTTLDFFLMAIMYLFAATSEEVIMRSYLMTRLRHLIHRPWLGVLISAFLFASYHGYQGFEGFANALFVGLLLGSLFAVYPRIWSLVICHTLSNIMLEFLALR
jgi:membrane protease YdiL (CAAX protease family)